jgi:hypothetical protein
MHLLWRRVEAEAYIAGFLLSSLFDPEDRGYVRSKRRSLSELYVSTTQKTVLFIDTTVRALNPTCTYYFTMSVRPSKSNTSKIDKIFMDADTKQLRFDDIYRFRLKSYNNYGHLAQSEMLHWAQFVKHLSEWNTFHANATFSWGTWYCSG